MPSQGRSVRELEEQMSALRKENFNLKLRIYFLEEGQPGAWADSSTESLSKQLIDAKIEIATLRKTVDVKMELLKDAARAISHHEELQRKADIDSQAIIDELQEQIHGYQVSFYLRARHLSESSNQLHLFVSLDGGVWWSTCRKYCQNQENATP